MTNTTYLAYYKIPRKRKNCIIVDGTNVFSTTEHYRTFLESTRNFSPAMSEQIINTLPQVSLEEIDKILTKLKFKPKERKQLEGVK